MIRIIKLQLVTSSRGSRMVHSAHSTGVPHSIVSSGRPAWEPPTDLYETEDCIVIEVNLAGVQPSVVRIDMTPRTIQISGTRQELSEGIDRHYHMVEIERGNFARTIHLPAPVQPNSAVVSYSDGLLCLKLAKVPGGYLQACHAGTSEDFE